MSDTPKYFTLTPEQLEGYVVDEEASAPKPPKGDKKPIDNPAQREIQEELVVLQNALDARCAEFSISSFRLETPALPPDFTKEHLAVLNEIFGSGNLEALVCPKLENINDDYLKMMYPESQRGEDAARGLISHHPSWWNNKMDSSISPIEEKVGDAYVRSIKSDVVKIQGSLFLTESIQKPKYINGSQQYGTKEGVDDSKDKLLSIVKEVFGAGANRFNLKCDQLVGELLPKVKEKIEDIFRNNHLSIPEFDVVLTPAVISNLQTTLIHPENSETNTYEWTSTVLPKQDGSDSGYRLVVGRSGNGGAGCVNDGHRGLSWSGWGFRLSVVLKNT